MTHDDHGPAAPSDQTDRVVELVTTRSDAAVAADLKRRFEEAMAPVCAIMDEAVALGLQVQFDNIAFFGPPHLRHKVNNLRVVKVY